jgi:hypothetical protein
MTRYLPVDGNEKIPDDSLNPVPIFSNAPVALDQFEDIGTASP